MTKKSCEYFIGDIPNTWDETGALEDINDIKEAVDKLLERNKEEKISYLLLVIDEDPDIAEEIMNKVVNGKFFSEPL